MAEIDLEELDLEELDLEKLGLEGLPFGLIFLDELERIREEAAELAQVPQKELVTVKKEDFQKSRGFLVKKISGLGALRSFMILAKSPRYSIRVETDGTERIDDTYSQLEELSPELSRLGAYEKNGKYMVSVTDYPFRDSLKITVSPQEEIIFTDLRLEAMVVKRPRLDPNSL